MGFPKLDGEKAKFVPMEMFPIEGDDLPEGFDGWLILLDELSSAPRAVQAAAYKITLDRQVGQHNLHKDVYVMAAGNMKSDNAIVNDMSTAMQSRLITLQMGVDHAAWIQWASNEGLDYRIKSYINFKPEILHKFDPNHNDVTFPCPRTWEMLSKIISPWKEISTRKMAILCGAVGEGAGREFHSFCQVFESLPSLESILADPEGITISSEPNIRFAIAGFVANNLNTDNFDTLIKFVKRLPAEFQIICMRDAVGRDRKLINLPAFTIYSQELATRLS